MPRSLRAVPKDHFLVLRAQLELIREAMLLSPASEEGVEHLRERERERDCKKTPPPHILLQLLDKWLGPTAVV